MIQSVRWSILIATLARREPQLRLVLADLREHLTQAEGAVEVVALRNHGERPLAQVRQSLIDNARGEYVSFVDDDDRLPPYYIPEVLPLLDGVDYVGWRMQAYIHGRPLKPTFHSLQYKGWSEAHDAYYRDVSHLNPVRTELARKCDFTATLPPEDVSWSDQLRPHVHTEHYINRVMYHYYATGDSTWRHGTEPPWDGYTDLLEPDQWDFPHLRWHPEST